MSETPAWRRPDGSTDVAEWLEAYAHDDNVIWASDSGELQSVIDELIEMLAARDRLLDPRAER